LLLEDLHKVGVLFVIDQALNGKYDEAGAFWLKMFKLDQSCLQSATFSETEALFANVDDLELLFFLQNFTAPENQQEILKALQGFEPEKISARRMLIGYYLHDLETADWYTSVGLPKGKYLALSVSTKGGFFRYLYSKAKDVWLHLIFKRDLFLHRINELYRREEELLQKPETITEETVRQFEQDTQDFANAPFWKFSHANEKDLKSSLSDNKVEIMKTFYDMRKALVGVRAELLAKPLFPPPPETQAAETQGSLTQPTETQSAPETAPVPSLPSGFSLPDQLKKKPEEVIQKQISSSTIDKETQDMDKLFTTARFIPNFFEGKPAGLKLLTVKPSSLFEQVGFQRGDILLAVNGAPLELQHLFIFGDPMTPKNKLDYLVYRNGKFVNIEVLIR
jgi:hypothetical protein